MLEQAALMTDDLVLHARHFLSAQSTASPAAAVTHEPTGDDTASRTLPERKSELEREAIAGALAATGGNRVAAAKLLKISRATLYEKLARWPELARGGAR